MRPKYTRVCRGCETPFIPNDSRQVYCTLECFLTRPRTKPNPVDLFWSRVDRSGGENACWIYGGNPKKYGKVTLGGGKYVRAHRFSYELAHGSIQDGLFVCHNCPGGDNPGCVNPAHLWLGTNAQNLADRAQKGGYATGDAHNSRRHPESLPRGESHKNARLTEALVSQLRADFTSGETSYKILGARYGVSAMSARNVITRKTWRHVA